MEKESGTLSGEGLKFGGEWATNLYDKQVGNIVSDLTGAKVEKLDMGLPKGGNETSWRLEGGTQDLKVSDLKVGESVSEKGGHGYNVWVVTDVLGNGKFKAIPKKELHDYASRHINSLGTHPNQADIVKAYKKSELLGVIKSFEIPVTLESAKQQGI